MAARGDRGVRRVLEKLEASITSGQYYEAHQMYRTLYFRYLSQKKYPDLLNLLHKGSILLLQNDQQGSGADLAILLVDVLTKSETIPSEEWIDKLAQIFEKMSSSIPERETFLTNSVKWSMENGKKGHPYLHKKVAEVYWKEKKLSAAHKHFLHSNDGRAYAAMLIDVHTSKGFKSEIDLFIAQAVLRILCLRNLKMANDAFNEYTASHPTIKNSNGPPYDYPLLNFLWFLLRVIEKRHITQFKILRSWYAMNLKRDPNYFEYLDKIGRVWMAIEVPRENNNPHSVFGGFLKSIIGDIDSSDEEDNTGQTSATPDLD